MEIRTKQNKDYESRTRIDRKVSIYVLDFRLELVNMVVEPKLQGTESSDFLPPLRTIPEISVNLKRFFLVDGGIGIGVK